MATAKYKVIMLGRGPSDDMEIPQRIAFTYGYRWPMTKVQSVYQNIQTGWCLTFDPNSKEIRTLSSTFAGQCDLVWGLTSLNQRLSNPILDIETVEAGNGTHEASIFEDAVTFRSKTSKLIGTVTVPKDFLLKIAYKVNPARKSLPVVEFDYPCSDPGAWGRNRTRYVRVTKCDDEYVQGFEIPNPTSTEEGTYKKYSQSKIAGNPTLCSFNEE